jgi:hypothetical protein
MSRLGHPARDGGLFERRNGDAHADTEDVAEFGIALIFVDDDKSLRVAQAFDTAHRRNAAECRNHH